MANLAFLCNVQVKRSQHAPKTVLSADLMAELLVNNGVFSHEGIEHVDRNYQGHNEGVLRRLAGRGISAAINLAFREGADYDADMWNSMEYMAISESYEFAVKDVVSPVTVLHFRLVAIISPGPL